MLYIMVFIATNYTNLHELIAPLLLVSSPTTSINDIT